MSDPLAPNIDTPEGLAAQLACDEAFPARREPSWCAKCRKPREVFDVVNHPRLHGCTMFVPPDEKWCLDCLAEENAKRLNLKGGLD